jgi:hypothetical protein
MTGRLVSCGIAGLYALLKKLLDAGNTQLLDPAFHAQISDIESLVLGWGSGNEAGMDRERLAGMVRMLRLLQDNSVLEGVEPHADLSDVKRKVTRLSSELYNVEKSLTHEEE